MKFIIDRDIALRAVTSVKTVIEKRNSVPILGNVLIEADAYTVRFVGTDMDVRRVETASAEVASPGETTVPVDILAKLLKEIPKGTAIEFEMETEPREGLRVRAGRLSALLVTLSADDFPGLGALPARRQTLTLPADRLADAMARVSFAISTEETRYYLNGIAFECRVGNTLRLIATDGHRLAVMDVPGVPCQPSEELMILPRKTCDVLQKAIAKEGNAPIDLGIYGATAKQATRFIFRHGDGTTSSKMIDGTFPDYTRIVPVEPGDGVLEYVPTEMAAVVKRLTAITSDRCHSVKVAINGVATLSACDCDGGHVSETIDARISGQGVEIGFNGNYLIEAGAAFGKDAAVHLAHWGAPNPARLTSPDVPGLTVVQMPLRV